MKKNGGVIQTVAFASYVKVAARASDGDQRPQSGVRCCRRPRAGEAVAGGAGRGAGGSAAARGSGGSCAAAGAVLRSERRWCGRAGRPDGGGRGGAAAREPALDALTPDRRAAVRPAHDGDRREVSARRPGPRCKDFVDHIDYLVKYIGIDHVGISSDFDGGGGVDGWNSAAETFNVTLELVRRGYTEEQIGKIWSGNLLRVWADVERVAKGIQAGTIR